MQTDRSAFLCLQRYQQVLNDYETAVWTEDQKERMRSYINGTMGLCDTTNWERGMFIGI